MKKDSQGMKIAIVIGVLVVLAIVIFFLVKGCVKEYTVTFDSNGGTSVSPIKVKENETITEPKAPTRDGYTFAGWYLDDVKFSFSTKITKDLTLKARWSSDEEPVVEDLELDVNTLSLTVGSSRKVKVTLSDALKNAKLVWKSSDESIATVDSDGNIKALKEGEVTITVSTEDGKYSKTIKVTVRPASDVSVSKVTISGSNTVEVGKTIKLTATVSPSNATNKNVTWKSSNPNIASVDGNGVVTGKKAGTVTITVTTEDGGKTASYTVTVKAASEQQPGQQDQPVVSDKVSVTGVKVNPTTKELKVGETFTPTVTVEPTNATNKNVTWKSSNDSVATVDANGKITAKKSGKATITVTTEDGKKTATIEVTVYQEFTVTFKDDNGTVLDTKKVKENNTVASYTPTKANYTFVEWQFDGKKYDFNTKVTKDITLTAKWEAIYTYYVEEVINELGQPEMFSRVYVYCGNKDVTTSAMAYSDKSNGYLGRYDSSQGAVVVKNTDIAKIVAVHDASGFHDATRTYTKR